MTIEEIKEWRMKHKKYIPDGILEIIDTLLAAEEDNERLKVKLSRYSGAVEVEGITDERGNGNTLLRLNRLLNIGTGQRVRVLVMKEVEK